VAKAEHYAVISACDGVDGDGLLRPGIVGMHGVFSALDKGAGGWDNQAGEVGAGSAAVSCLWMYSLTALRR
jgi:hypothetical protein